MYAVIKTGGKQHRVEPGEVLKLEKLSVEAGQTVDFDEVMMLKSALRFLRVEKFLLKSLRMDVIRR